METVKRARKTMVVLAIIPACLCVLGIVGYFLTGKDGLLGLLAGWTIFSAVIVSQAEGAIKTLEREIESLKSGGSADTTDPTPPEDE